MFNVCMVVCGGRIRFSIDLDIILHKIVVACDNHIAEHRTLQDNFEEAL